MGENERFISIKEGIWMGVEYRINNAEFVDKDGFTYLKFDYDVKGLDESKSDEFEKFLGEFITRAIDYEIEMDRQKGGDIGF